MSDTAHPLRPDTLVARVRKALHGRAVVVVGMMGAGKTSVGKRLASRLELPFVDADAEIERAAGLSIPEIFARHGEPYFREGERRVIGRLLADAQIVLATGGGAYMHAETRAGIRRTALSIWLKADFDILMKRVRKRSNRPLLQTADPEAAVRRLIDERHPIYAQADVSVMSRDVPHDVIVEETLQAMAAFLAAKPFDDPPPPQD